MKYSVPYIKSKYIPKEWIKVIETKETITVIIQSKINFEL